jgi:hypothetical protein
MLAVMAFCCNFVVKTFRLWEETVMEMPGKTDNGESID